MVESVLLSLLVVLIGKRLLIFEGILCGFVWLVNCMLIQVGFARKWRWKGLIVLSVLNEVILVGLLSRRGGTARTSLFLHRLNKRDRTACPPLKWSCDWVVPLLSLWLQLLLSYPFSLQSSVVNLSNVLLGLGTHKFWWIILVGVKRGLSKFAVTLLRSQINHFFLRLGEFFSNRHAVKLLNGFILHLDSLHLLQLCLVVLMFLLTWLFLARSHLQMHLFTSSVIHKLF